jgi:hypothetical protein
MFHVPVERGGQTDETQGFGCGSTIENHDVELLALSILVDVHHGAEFFHSGEDGHLLGLDSTKTGGAEHGGNVKRDFLPMALDLVVNVDFLDE